MREAMKVNWPRVRYANSSSMSDSIRNYTIIRNNLGINWWFNEVTIGEAAQAADLHEANVNIIYTNWNHYEATKGWI
jgi:hypothetical protein